YIRNLKALDLSEAKNEATFTSIRWPSLPQE
ncbi:TPA: phage tail protein, partial [Salmonella enterica subsp. enterica serovar Welikade]|nr:phage tail protein [Salmonella enterica subsp. enterica]